MHRQPDDIWRIDYQLRDDEDPEEAVKPENVLPRVRSHLEMMGERGDWTPIWISDLQGATALTLERYRHGRVLFAGDAAHLVPIFGVRGANSGIDDADNLAWKLAFVVKGLAPDTTARHVLERAGVRRAREPELRHQEHRVHGAAVASPSRSCARLCSGYAREDPGLRSLINPRQTSAITYADSPLNAADSDALPAGPVPGAVLAECPIETMTRLRHLTELLGAGYTVLWLTGDDPRAELAELGDLPLSGVWIAPRRAPGTDAWDATGRLFPLYGAAPAACYLVRPDGHVAGRWRAPRAGSIRSAVQRALD